ncbi:DNA-binding transcriptional LysR family regulator [Paraburkholderia sp. 40]
MKTSTDELLVFVTVIDSGSITAAAEKLGQTISGVSRALKRVERGRLAVLGQIRRAREHAQPALAERARMQRRILQRAVLSGFHRGAGQALIRVAEPSVL